VTTQIATVYVPSKGFQGQHNELTFQVPHQTTFQILKKIVLAKKNLQLDPTTCQVATTVAALGKTLDDDPQGEAGAHLIISHQGKNIPVKAVYFGILFNKTNPFVLNDYQTSEDGGAIIYNLPASEKLYKITAMKPGKQFSSEFFYCRPGAFINLSPPHGVNALN
jgi:hypothetical protein